MNYYQQKRFERFDAEAEVARKAKRNDLIGGVIGHALLAGMFYWIVISFIDSL